MDAKVTRGSALLSETDTEESDEAPLEQVAVLSVLDAASGIVLTQNPIVAGDEVAAAHQAVTDLAQVSDLRGCLFTADARHTVRAAAAQLRGHGGHYLFRVGGNTPPCMRW